ncbi:sigma-70 family RNA polymerase sigma factor [Pseudonocardia nantongensis]|uniref:sigma-70 family RNA polymerase sigma factor n=1 Tax=Pseudonocardia nantongensis TaxID=1181885 RepID=UPI00397E1230
MEFDRPYGPEERLSYAVDDRRRSSPPLSRATITLTQRLGRAPRPSELAEELDVDTSEVIEALGAMESNRAVSLDAPTPDGETPLSERLGDDDPGIETASTRGELREQINALPERERRILLLRFYRNRTQTEIAADVDVSQMHVSRLLSRTIGRLRAELNG